MEVSGKAEQAAGTEVPVSFRVSTYWKRARNEAGPTSEDSRRLTASEALQVVLSQFTDDEATVTSKGPVTTIVIDWSKVPPEISNPFLFGVKR